MTNPYEAPLSTSPATDGPTPIDPAGLPSPGGIGRTEYFLSNLGLAVFAFGGIFVIAQAEMFPLFIVILALCVVGHFYVTWKRFTNLAMHKAWILLYFVGAGFIPIGMALGCPENFGLYKKLDNAGIGILIAWGMLTFFTFVAEFAT